MRFSSVFLLETLCFCSVFMIKLAPEKLCYYFFLLCFHYWGHCNHCWQGGPDGGEELWAGHEAALHPKGHCSEEVGELHRQLEQARKESSVAPRDRELVLVRRELGGPSGSWMEEERHVEPW